MGTHGDEYPRVVVSGLVLSTGRVFLARFPKWQNKWAIPGGKVEYGEALKDALRREIREETSLEVLSAELLRVSEVVCDPAFADGRRHLILLDYVVRRFNGSPSVDQRELTEFRWVPLGGALELDLTPPTRASILALLEKQSAKG